MIDPGELRRIKAEIAFSLPQIYEEVKIHHLDVFTTDKRIDIYVEDVVQHPENHNLYELLGIRHFFHKVSTYEWKPGRVKRFIRLYEHLKFSGLKGRRSYKLTPIQTFIFANIYGFYFKGRRLHRDITLFVPRKFSKTTSIASMAVYDVLFGDANAQTYVGANSFDQAKICFDEIRNIFLDIDPNERHTVVNRQKITLKTKKREAFARCLTSNAKTGDGLSASLAIIDEYAQARDTAKQSGAALKNVLTSSMGAREEPLTVVMTTGSEVLDGPFARELEGIKAGLREGTLPDSHFAVIFEPDVDDDEGDPRTWKKVQPHIGVTIQDDFYEREWARAQLSADNMLVFRTKLLNIFAVSERTSWVSANQIRKAMSTFRVETLLNRPPAMCSIDLSERWDFSTVSFCIYNSENKKFYFHTDYFFPKGSLSGNPNEAIYRIWAEQGYLILLEGEVIDYRAIVNHILSANKNVQILRIGYDQWKSLEVVNMLSAAGAKNVLLPVKQTYGNFNAPVETFEHGIFTDHVVIDDNPITAYCFTNAVLDVDKLENKKPIRRNENYHIDGVITMLMCMRLFIDYEQ